MSQELDLEGLERNAEYCAAGVMCLQGETVRALIARIRDLERAQRAGEAGEPVAWIQQDRGNTVVVWRESPKKFDVGTKFYADPVPAKKCSECNGLGTSDGRDGALIPCFACDGKGVAAPQPVAVPDGFVLVPVTPTDEMLATLLSEGEYGVLAHHSADPIAASAVLRLSGVASRYADMLAAAPQDREGDASATTAAGERA